jgi:hypothetical protein
MNSYTPSLAELELRLAKLERQNRRLKHLGLLFLLIAGASFLLAQASCQRPGAAPGAAAPAATYDTLVVHRLELRDKAGKLRGVWEATDERSSLWLYDTAEEPRALLAVGADGPYLALYDAAGKLRAALAEPAEGPGLALYDTSEKPRATLNVSADGPGLTLYDSAGKPRAGLAVAAKGTGLGLSDAAGKTRTLLTEDGLWRP